MKKFLRLFSYVRTLEADNASLTNVTKSMTRHITALEGVKDHLEEQIKAVTKERDDLYAHLNGRAP